MVHPAANTLVATLGQQNLDISEAQGKPNVKPDHLLEDFGR
jgi:hypothetical protein